MSEVSGAGREGGLPASSSAGADLSAGVLLRQAREAAGMSQEVLAASLKVTVDKLAALEADRWEALPDMVFARGLAASVCRALNLDPAPVLQHLPQVGPRLAPQTERINAPFKAERSGTGLKNFLSRPVGLAVLVLLVAAGALWFVPTARESAPPAPTSATPPAAMPAPAAVPAITTVTEGAQPASTAAGSAPVEPAAAVAPAAVTAPPAPAVPAAGAAASTAPAAAPAPVAAPSTSATPAPSDNSLVGFQATADSWIKVTDARGVVVLSRLVRAGESANASGTVPLAVVVGRADATRVTVRGQAMDLAPITRDNVARFEVK